MAESHAGRTALVAALATARATVASLEAALEQADAGPSDELLDLAQLRAEYSVGRDGARAAIDRGELAASRGPRGKVLVARFAVEAWLRSRPVQVRARRAANVIDLDSWEREQEQELRRVGGGR